MVQRDRNGSPRFMGESCGKSFQLIIGREHSVEMCTVKNEYTLFLELSKGTHVSTECLEVASNLEII